MTNTFIPHFSCRITLSVLNHRACTTSSAAARNLSELYKKLNTLQDLVWFGFLVLNAIFNNISVAVSVIGGGNRSTEENTNSVGKIIVAKDFFFSNIIKCAITHNTFVH
jgi:hypothetical protein